MKPNKKREFFIGIDLGWKEKKTTGICILEEDYNPPTTSEELRPFAERAGRVAGGSESHSSEWAPKDTLFPSELWCEKCQVILGGEILRKISPLLKNTKAIAIDAPLTRGRGKGDMRLYEKFLSTKIFKEEKVSPIPPALMAKLCSLGRELKRKLGERGFVLDTNLIEVFPTITKKLCNDYIFLKLFGKSLKDFSCRGEDQKSALLCASLAYLHSRLKTRYLGYKDGFLFLPEMSFWTKEWRQRFYQAWMARSRLKYRYLITNLFEKKS